MVNRATVVLLLFFGISLLPLNAQQTEAAKKLFSATKARADKGDAQSQLVVAEFYVTGTGVSADSKKAVKYYRKAAEQGLAQGQFKLGVHYQKGIGIAEDEYEAVLWFTKAADQGLLEAQLELARCYMSGKGTDVNGAEAVRWFRQAAAQGSSAAEFWIGKCYFEGTGVSRDVQEGLDWTRRAAEAGYPAAQEALGNCYLKGTGVEKNYVQAYKWFALAAAQEDSRAPDIRVNMAKTENFLTKDQVAEAQRLAREFNPSKQPGSGSTESSSATQDSGTVTVSTEDGQSEVYVDAAFMGTTPAKLKLKEGVHVIEVKKAGYADYRRELKVTGGSDLNLRAVMQKQ